MPLLPAWSHVRVTDVRDMAWMTGGHPDETGKELKGKEGHG